MRVRQPTFDFSRTPVHWSKVPEFAQFFNAASVGIPQLERFLNRTMASAGAKLNPADSNTEQLKADIRTFIRQEASHYTNHGAFNEMVASNYDKITQFERELADDFERLTKTKSLAFLCSYCDGFETTGPPGALMWLDDKLQDFIGDADPEVIRLWKWHLMEEYEHRTVAFDVFNAIHGGYFMRVYGLIYHLFHFHGYVGRVLNYMLECDRAKMSTAEIQASRKRERKLRLRLFSMIGFGALKAMWPFYTPRRAREPVNFRPYMAKVEEELGQG